MKVLGYTLTYSGGRELARSMGYEFAYVVASNTAPLKFTVMVN